MQDTTVTAVVIVFDGNGWLKSFCVSLVYEIYMCEMRIHIVLMCAGSNPSVLKTAAILHSTIVQCIYRDCTKRSPILPYIRKITL